MTHDRDIERVLDRFYAEGPSEMPDRVFLGVFDRIERVPQRRLALQMTRFAAMNTNLRPAAAAAIVVAVVGVGAFALSQRPTVGPYATPSPTPAAASTATAGPDTGLPDDLQHRWVGAPRVVAEAPEPPSRIGLIVESTSLQFQLTGAGNLAEFASTAVLDGTKIRLRMASGDGGCQPEDEGVYDVALSAAGTALHVQAFTADQCPSRAAALAGDWVRASCPDVQGWCLGDLQPGAHTTVVFTPLVDPANWTYSYGRFSYTVPAGWTNGEDCPWCLVLAKQGAPANTGINVWSDAVAHAQADQCSQAPEPRVGRTADAITTWLTTLPGLVTTLPTPVTIGGLSGKEVDLSVAPTWTASCPYAYSAGLPLVSTFSAPTAGDGFDWNIQGAGKTRIIALDLGNGRTIVIDIEAQSQADFDALLPDAMQVVNSFRMKS